MDYETIPQLLRDVASRHRDRTAYQYKSGGRWHDVSWGEQYDRIEAVSKGLLRLGIEKGDRVVILSQTRPEWVQADFGIVNAGGVTVGVYPSNLPPECAYIFDHCDAEIAFVENREQMDKVLSVRGELPKLRHIVAFQGPATPDPGVMSWEEFLAGVEGVDSADLESRARSLGPEDLASIVYTSGTTGVPKGAMLTHRNILFTSGSAYRALDVGENFRTILFLPLAHVFARLIVNLCVLSAGTLAFAESIQTVMDDIRAVRPDFIASVPRVYEKIYGKITSGVEEAGRLKSTLFYWALEVGKQAGRLEQERKPVPTLLRIKRSIANRLVFRKIHELFGGRMLWAVSGAAPLNKDIGEFFHGCGILIREGIGMTENSSFSNVNPRIGNKFGTVGPVGPGIEMRIANDGEILFRGPNIMRGYLKDEKATAEAIDAEGWLHTGDVGEIDADGYLKVTDRKKDIIITAGGKNVAPQRIERILRTSRYISQVVAVGDKRKFITVLITLDPETVTSWAREKGVAFDDLDKLAETAEVRDLIQAEIDSVNRRLASYESIKSFRILPGELSIEGGELTPTLKVRRKVVMNQYHKLIENMYAE